MYISFNKKLGLLTPWVMLSREKCTCLCGYFIQKCMERHSCEMCLNYITNQNQLDQSLLFIYFKAYTNSEVNSTDSTFGKLNVPTDQFLNYINN